MTHFCRRPPERWKEEAKGSSSLPHRGAARASVAFGGISSDPDGNPTSRSTVSINVNPLGRTPSMVSGSTVIDGDQQRTTHVNSGAFPVNDYQFPEIIQNKGKNIQLNYVQQCLECNGEDLSELDYLAYDLSGYYDVERNGRKKMEFVSEATLKYPNQKVHILIERQE